MSRRQIDSCGELRIFLSDVWWCVFHVHVCVCMCVCTSTLQRPLFTASYWCIFTTSPTSVRSLWWWEVRRPRESSRANSVSVSSRSGGDTNIMSLTLSLTVNPLAQLDESHPSPGLCESSDNRQEEGRSSVVHKAHILTLGGLTRQIS